MSEGANFLFSLLCIFLLFCFLMFGVPISLLCILDANTDRFDDVIECVKEKRTNRLSQKAIKDDAYMLKFIKEMVHAEKRNKKYSIKTKDYITTFLSVLKENHTYDDFYAYQKDCIDRLDQMKNIIRHYYQDDTYRNTAAIILSCLSIIEVNLLTSSFDSDWEKKVDKYLCNCLYICSDSLFHRNKPKKWVNKIRKKEIRSEDWCDALLEDLKLLKIYYKPYQFDKDGWVYFDK